jgi:hypothetical protein
LTNGSVTAWLCFGFCRGPAFRFFGRRRVGAMADRRHHGEDEQDQGHVTMPAMPGPALIVIEPELVFRGFKAVLDRPSMAFDRDQRFDGGSGWTPGGEESAIRRRINRPRVHKLSFALLDCSAPDRPIRDNTNHAAAVPWFQRPPTGASNRMSAASGRCPRPCRRLPQDRNT